MSHNAALTKYRTLGWIFCKSYVLGFSRETELTGGVYKIGNGLCGYGGWEVPQLAVCKLYIQESWWYYSAWVQTPGNQRSLWCFFQSDTGGLRTRCGCGQRGIDLSPRVQRPRTQGPEVQGQETRDIPAQEVRARTHLSFTFLVGSVQAAKGLDDVRLSGWGNTLLSLSFKC